MEIKEDSTKNPIHPNGLPVTWPPRHLFLCRFEVFVGVLTIDVVYLCYILLTKGVRGGIVVKAPAGRGFDSR
jgi:hypothetical protein